MPRPSRRTIISSMRKSKPVSTSVIKKTETVMTKPTTPRQRKMRSNALNRFRKR